MKNNAFSKNMLILSLLSGGVFIYSLYRLDPRSGSVNIAIFLVSLFVVVFSLFAAINYLILRKTSNNERHYAATKGSLRRGLLLGLYVVGVLGLGSLELLTWWDALLLALSLVLFELYFISGKENTA